MLRVLESDAHAERLRELVSSFRVEERRMTTVLRELQARLEADHHEASRHRIEQGLAANIWLDRSDDLQEQCDALAAELAHCRLAISGTCEELAQHQDRRVARGRDPRIGACG